MVAKMQMKIICDYFMGLGPHLTVTGIKLGLPTSKTSTLTLVLSLPSVRIWWGMIRPYVLKMTMLLWTEMIQMDDGGCE